MTRLRLTRLQTPAPLIRRSIRQWCSVGETASCLLFLIVAVISGCNNAQPFAGEITVSSGSENIEPAQQNSAKNLSSPTFPTGSAPPEQIYVIGPDAARILDFRIDWQTQISGVPKGGMRRMDVQGDSVFVLDGANFLTRFRRNTGDQFWRIPVTDEVTEVLGITYIPSRNRVFVTQGGDVGVFDAGTGSKVGKHKLTKIANTAPTQAGRFLIYGAQAGQAIWYVYDLGFQWSAYQIAPSIEIQPIVQGSLLIIVGNNGRIMALASDSAQQLWDKRLLDDVVCSPAVTNRAVYVAGTDQHLWAFDIDSGRNIWRYLTESPLTQSPVVIDDAVYQQVPTEGLVCLEAMPSDAPGGRVRWTAQGVYGSVLTTRGDNLLVWDQNRREMTILTRVSGHVVSRIDLPRVWHLVADDLSEGDVFAADDKSRIIRLVPKH